MTSYLSIVPKYLSMHKKKTRLVVLSVAIAVALVTGIFSMLDFFQQFEKIQQIHEYGNYHLLVKNVTDEEKQVISGRIDVKNSGTWISLRNGTLSGKECRLSALDEKFAPNMNITLLQGKYPVEENEIMLEGWASESFQMKTGDTVKVIFADSKEKEFKISGIYNDFGSTKASGMPGVLLSISGADMAGSEKASYYLIEFKNGVNIKKAENEIKSILKPGDNRIGRNERLLAFMGQGASNTVMNLYATGAVLFLIVLIAGVMMIYNTFNISVMERVRQFGLLRCIGASPSQIKKLVRREGVQITLRAVPIGILAGMLLAFLCSVILKYYNSSLFREITLFNISIVGIAAGIAVGFLTVLIASALPAKKAARVSPVNAVTGSSDMKIPKKKKRGLLAKMFHAEIAMGVNNAVVKKKTLFLMSCSIAISIVMFLGFQVLVDFMHSALKTSKPYTPDIVLAADRGQGLSNALYEELSALDGVKKVYGRRLGYVNATFDASRLTGAYRKIIGEIPETDDGRFIPPEKSWLISYDKNQLEWAKTDLVKGELSMGKLNGQNGVIAVALPLRKGVGIETASLQLGDKVYIQSPGGAKEMTVMAILRTVPFSDSGLSLTTFITTEKLFTELTGDSAYKVIDIQLDRLGQEQTVSGIKGMLDESVSLYDQRQKNDEIDGYFLTMAVFIYGFVIVIALISVLNIANTMNTSIVSRTKYLGVMRAVGMSGVQLDRMALAEAVTYSLTGGIAGCILGIAMQKMLIINFLPRLISIWKFPYMQIALIIVLIMLVTVMSVTGPLKRIKAQGISEVIGSL